MFFSFLELMTLFTMRYKQTIYVIIRSKQNADIYPRFIDVGRFEEKVPRHVIDITNVNNMLRYQ